MMLMERRMPRVLLVREMVRALSMIQHHEGLADELISLKRKMRPCAMHGF
jgi:hypothetical protein